MKNEIFVVEKSKLEEVECEFTDAEFYRLDGKLEPNYYIGDINCIKHYRESPSVVETYEGSCHFLDYVKFFKTVSKESENTYTMNLNHTTLCKIQAILSTMRWYIEDAMDSELKDLTVQIEKVTGINYHKTEYAFAKKNEKGEWTEVQDAFVVPDQEFYAR